ncbi:hypothetical protein CPB86DRAFT_831030 [Serendipita vermifera]|nr:hypothetical protein CPB86DRAFT_831030 [Serendipita vermifera]
MLLTEVVVANHVRDKSAHQARRSRSSVQSTLIINEILYMITRFLQGDHLTLSALARTCKAWSPLAARELWREVWTRQLNRLVQEMGQEASPHQPQWLSRIEVYHMDVRKHDASSGMLLSHFRPRSIIVEEGITRPFPSNCMSQLRTLVVNGIKGMWRDDSLTSVSFALILAKETLRTLDVGPIIPRSTGKMLLSYIGELHTLQTLKLTVTDDCALTWFHEKTFNWESTGAPSGSRRLPDLKELVIEAPIPIVKAFLSITGNKLERLRILGAPFDVATDVADMFTQIGNSWFRSGITHFSYGISSRWTTFDDWTTSLLEWGLPAIPQTNVQIYDKHLLPILQLFSLSHLSLCFHFRPNVNDNFLHQLALNLSNLDTLSVTGRTSLENVYPFTTLKGIYTLTQMPTLTSLNIAFDSRLKNTEHTFKNPSSNLAHLAIAPSPSPSSPSDLAKVLATMLPNLRRVYVPAHDSLDDDDFPLLLNIGWDAVWDCWKGARHELGYKDHREIFVQYCFPLDNTEPRDADDYDGSAFFMTAVRESIMPNEEEDDSFDYLTQEVDLEEYYARFPESRRPSLIPVAVS